VTTSGSNGHLIYQAVHTLVEERLFKKKGHLCGTEFDAVACVVHERGPGRALHSPGLAIQVHDLLPRLSVSQVRLRADESE